MQIINTLYHNILEGEKYINNLNLNNYNNTEINHILLNSRSTYFPNKIQDYIKHYMHYKITHKTKLNGKNININLYTISKYSNTKIHNIIFKILLIIYLLNLYTSSNCSKNIDLDIYFTPFKRFIPTNPIHILEPIHVNGGFSTAGCHNKTSITIYREEEWYKVLIHELFHNLDLDFATMNIDKQREILKELIGINSKYNIYETYCETWARILNVMIVSFLNKKPTYRKFLSEFKILMLNEINFSIIQSNKIMSIIINSGNKYREKTNALCYYVFTAALLSNYKDFLYWCNKHNNNNIIKFKQTKNNVDNFCQFILNCYNNQVFFKAMQLCNNIKLGKNNHSLRMTIT